MSGLGLLNPGRGSDYGTRGRSAWLDVDWSHHVHDVEIGGRRVRYADAGVGERTLLLVHGLGASWQCWLENIPDLASDRRVVALDLPGFGRSEMPGWDISIEAYGGFLSDLMEALGIRRADVVGNSMGGFIAAELAIKAPARVRSLCLVSPAILWQEYRRARPLLTLAQTTEATTARALAGAQKTLATRPRPRALALRLAGIRYPHLLSGEFATELVRTARRTRGFVPALGALSDYPVREELPKIDAPTLLIWGKHDTLVSIKHADQIAALIPGSRVEKWDRTGHVAMAERPARFNRVLRAFLDESDGAERAEPGAGTNASAVIRA